jgi:hypothetical protein
LNVDQKVALVNTSAHSPPCVPGAKPRRRTAAGVATTDDNSRDQLLVNRDERCDQVTKVVIKRRAIKKR